MQADQKALQQKALEFEMHREQAKQVQQEIMRLGAQVHEFESIKESLKSLEKEKEGADALIPVGAGIFVSGKLSKISEVLVSVGAGVVVKKTILEAEKFLDEKSLILKKAISELEGEMQRIGASAQSIQKEIQQLSAPK